MSLLLGALLLGTEFSLTFGSLASLRIVRNVVLTVLWPLNPFGTIGWLLCVKRMAGLQASIWIFLLGSALSGVMWGHVAGAITRCRAGKRDRKKRW
ncbi:hypothetical protein JIN84_03225 [Luteolibacter yonseiensis]|uniref:Uncharacterized protein n=1 Tax=Luteolibacter yonseiensis TaxID=1144680 RepID=A0A934QXM7_9BACT|nr:hypothetical protein [Luteolibacter yonseiensis]MBK1814608.1 hypothetical protein [Luteolibacter yonseiensis]